MRHRQTTVNTVNGVPPPRLSGADARRLFGGDVLIGEVPATVDLSGGFDGPSAKARGSSVLPCGPICPQCGCEFTAASGLARHLVRVHGFLGDEADQVVRLAGPRQARTEQFGERATARPL